MTVRNRGHLAIAGALVAMVGLEAVALRSGLLGTILLGVAGGLAVLVAASGVDLARVGTWAALACAFTLTWNGWFIGPVRPGDVLILTTLLCFALAAPTSFRGVPWWVKQASFAVLLVAILVVLFPPDAHYLDERTVLDAGGNIVLRRPNSLSLANLGTALKFIVSLAAIPMAFTCAAVVDRRSVRRLAAAFTFGAAASGLAAFIDHTHVFSIGSIITGLPNVGDRQVGFADHPNFLAAGLVLAIPFACWLMVAGSRAERAAGICSLASMVLGVYASGSRGGAVCAVAAVVFTLLLLPRTRPHMPPILLGGVVASGLLVAVFPSMTAALLKATRLAGNPNSAGSDIVRAKVGAQGVTDFLHSPLRGVGLQVSTEASQVYLQELASGGLILFIGMTLYLLGSATAAFGLIRREAMAAAILGSILTTALLNLVEADLTDRFYYVPEAILVAMMTIHRVTGVPVADPPPRRTVLEESLR